MAKGILSVTEKGKLGEIYNIGSNNEYSVIEMANLLCKLFNKELNLKYIPDRNFNDKRYFIDCTKVLALGWKEEILFQDGILYTINYYKNKHNL